MIARVGQTDPDGPGRGAREAVDPGGRARAGGLPLDPRGRLARRLAQTAEASLRRSSAGTTADTSTGIPFSTALPESGSIRSERARTLLFDPACSPGDRELDAFAVVAPAVGDADDPGHHRVGDLDRDLDRSRLGADRRRLAVGEAEALRVVGVDVRGALRAAADQAWDVVHPGVVRAEIAPPDQDHAAVRPAPQRLLESRQVGDDRLRGQLDPCRWRCGASPGGEAGAGRDRPRAGTPPAGPGSVPSGSSPKRSP